MRSLSTLLAALSLAAPALAGGPFSDLGFDAASAKAKEGGKLLLVDFTATWCPPCKMMEKQTWPAESVGTWIAEHAVAIQVDTDKEPQLAQRFRIQSIPTVVFLRDGEELDRHTGFQAPEAFVKWGEDVRSGKSSAKAAAEEGRSLLESDDVDARYDAAEAAAERGELDLALEHYLWLWPHTREVPSYAGVRLSFMLSDMASLAERHPPAAKAFAEILDQLQATIDGADVPPLRDWMEWSSLCQHFDGHGRVVTWYEKRRDAKGRLFEGASDFARDRMVGDVYDSLLEVGRPVDAVRLYDDIRAQAGAEIERLHSMNGMLDDMPEEARGFMRAYNETSCRDSLATLYAAALADGRTEQAADVAEQLLRELDDGTSRVTLVDQTLKLTTQRPAQLSTWLDEAEGLGVDVTAQRERLVAAPSGG